MKFKLIRVVALVLVALAGVLFVLLRQTSEPSDKHTLQDQKNETEDLGIQNASSSYTESSIEESDEITQTHNEQVQEGLETIFEGLKEMGAIQQVSTAMETLSKAIDYGDLDAIRQAFHEITYGRFAQMNESILAMRAYLDSTTPYVQFLAAEALLRVGDKSGVEVLIELSGKDAPTFYNGTDIRLQSARVLGYHAISQAYPSLLSLYEDTGDGSVINALAHMQPLANEHLVEAIKARRSPGFVALNLGLIRAEKERVILEETFKNPAVPNIYKEQTKTAAAWALARITGGEIYIDFLRDSARPAIESDANDGFSYNDSTKALMYLGSVQSPLAVEVLETALESENPVAVQYAAVNLLFNQPDGSEKAEQLVLAEFGSSPSMLGTDLAMQIASKSDNSKIREAAEAYARRTGSDRWRYWGKERSDWPIENWVYDYVFVLNR